MDNATKMVKKTKKKVNKKVEEAKSLVEKGKNAATLWYWGQVVISIPSYFVRRGSWRIAMLKNIAKVAVRQLRKHKLFFQKY